MFKKIKYLLCCCALLGLAGCTGSGAERTLDDMASALSRHDSAAFLSKIDMSHFAANRIKNMTQNNEALSSLNALGKMLGIGGVDQMLNSVMDMQARTTQELDQGVSTGELVLQCSKSDIPDCPWVPESLRDATIVELNADAAIARITTPRNLTSWLALSKINGKWLVVAQAVMESQAKEFALNAASMRKEPDKPAQLQQRVPNDQSRSAAPVNI